MLGADHSRLVEYYTSYHCPDWEKQVILNFQSVDWFRMPRVFLGNLAPDTRVEDIEDFFRDFGKVRNVLIKQGKFGFAEFDRSRWFRLNKQDQLSLLCRDAEDAVHDQHGRSLLGNRVTVELAKGPRGGDTGSVTTTPTQTYYIHHCLM